MRTNSFIFAAALWLLTTAVAPASLSFDSTTQNGGSPINLTVPDGNTVGIQSTLNVSGLGILASTGDQVSLTLNISGGNNGDLYAYLSYAGQIVTLINRPGVTGGNLVGYTGSGFDVTLRDGSYNNINTYAEASRAQVTGTFNPNDGATTFQAYNGMNPNGGWILFVADKSGGDPDENVLNSWSLTFDVVPEPVNVALGIFAALLLAVVGFRRLRRLQQA